MKVLFFIDSLRSGGKERRLTELMKGLKSKKDFSFELVIMDGDVHYKEVFDLNIKIHYLIRESKKDWTIFKKLNSICNEFKPDILHCWDSMTAFYCIPICLFGKIKLINAMIVNAPKDYRILNKNIFRSLITFPFSDVILANSNAGILSYKAPFKRTRCIYNGYDFIRTKNLIDIKVIKTELSVTTTYVVGMVASFSPLKDYETFFNAIKIILQKRSDVTFIAIGSKTDSQEAMKLISGIDTTRIKLLGKKTNIESYINLMDVCVLSTFTEGISNSIMEYMAMSKPVVATAGGGTAEIIANGLTGYLIEQSNPEQLATKINCLLDNKELRLKMGLNGKQRIQTVFNIEKMVNQIYDVYIKTLKNEEINYNSRPDIEPIFIAGAQRSGTTLLRIILNSSSKIAIPEEGTFLMPLLNNNYQDRFISKDELNKFMEYLSKSPQFHLWNYNTFELFDELKTLGSVKLATLIDLIYMSYARSEGKSNWGDKTPSFFRKLKFISNMYPNFKVVHIIRDGRDTFISWRKIDSKMNNIAIMALEWKYKIMTLEKDIKRYNKSKAITIRYEDLITSPEAIIKQICYEFSLPYEVNMLNFYINSKNYIGDHHSELIFKPIDKENKSKWKSKLTRREKVIFDIIAGNTLIEYNYIKSNAKAKLTDYCYLIWLILKGVPLRSYQILRNKRIYARALKKGKAVEGINFGKVSNKELN